MGDDDIKFGRGFYDLTQPEPLPDAARQRVLELLDSGRLHRYQGKDNDVAELEQEFSQYIGLPYAMACNSGGCGLFLALKALGVGDGDKVLTNAWTLPPVPGAVVHAGASPVFVATDPITLQIDMDDLERKVEESGAKVLMMSYMRGQVPNLDSFMAVVERLGLTLVEDCAHTLGSTWKFAGTDRPRHLGTFGAVGVWSNQTNKPINSGEGGIVATARQDVAAFITVATGSYGHFAMHGASGENDYMQKMYLSVPNMSMRMTNIAAALARPQLANLPEKLKIWEKHALSLRSALSSCPFVGLVSQKHYEEGRLELVWTSIQFRFLDFTVEMINAVIADLAEKGIPIAWFGGPPRGFTSTLKDWRFDSSHEPQWNNIHEATTASLVDLPLYHVGNWSDAAISKLGAVLVQTINAHAPNCTKQNE